MSLDPPPRVVSKFTEIWRDWLYFFWDFIQSHTSGGTPTPPATGLSWNAHGNTAITDGAADNALKVETASFIVTGSPLAGETPTELSAQGNHFCWIADKASLRAGVATTTGQWADANIGDSSVAIGRAAQATAGNAIAMGSEATVGTVPPSGTPFLYGSDGIAIGTGAVNTGQTAIAIGSLSVVTSQWGTAIGRESESTGNLATAVGLQAKASGGGAVAVGTAVSATNTNSVCIGVGAGYSVPMVNPDANTVWMGAGSVDPTLILQNSRAGILYQTPLSTLDIGGSVGFKYTTLNATDGDTYSITGDEYTFRIDLGSFTSTSDAYTIQLPTISSTAIDRRVYYFKITDISHIAGNHGNVLLKPEASQYIEDFVEGRGHRFAAGVSLPLESGNAVTIIANDTDKTWWVI